ncbi:hypothetical protein [Nonlabens sp.]|uniref:hypothetical protein n=1 Tax=Nonlabens sp. TaxID=1888209 RepID=UPI0032633B89
MESKQKFIIGQNNFFFDESKCVIEYYNNEVIDFTFVGNNERFETLEENNDFEFKDFIYSPKLYIRNLTLSKNMQSLITENNHLDSEIGLYFGEHGIFIGEVCLKNNCVRIIGFGEVYGEKYPVKINYTL